MVAFVGRHCAQWVMQRVISVYIRDNVKVARQKLGVFFEGKQMGKYMCIDGNSLGMKEQFEMDQRGTVSLLHEVAGSLTKDESRKQMGGKKGSGPFLKIDINNQYCWPPKIPTNLLVNSKLTKEKYIGRPGSITEVIYNYLVKKLLVN